MTEPLPWRVTCLRQYARANTQEPWARGHLVGVFGLGFLLGMQFRAEQPEQAVQVARDLHAMSEIGKPAEAALSAELAELAALMAEGDHA